MELEKNGDGDGGKKHMSSSKDRCSICLEPVIDTGERSLAKLPCGHEFHLDCIGSAFNIKKAMQCPLCRKIEKGQWKYATGPRTYTDYLEDWAHDEDHYDVTHYDFYAEMFGVQWCPFGFSGLPSFEEGEFPSTLYQDFFGQHAGFSEHTAVSTHQCPYVAFYGPLHSSSPSFVSSVSDGPNFSNQWGGPSGPTERQNSYAVAAMEPHYQGWEHHPMTFSATVSQLGSSDQTSSPFVNQRSSRTNPDLPRPGSFGNPFGTGHRGGSSVRSSMVPHYPGSVAQARDRVQAPQASFQSPSISSPLRTPLPMFSGTQRSNHSNGHRGVSQVGPPPLSADQAGVSYVFPSATSSQTFSEAENPSRFRGSAQQSLESSSSIQPERDSSGALHSTAGGPNSFHQWHGSERSLPRSRS